MSKFLYFFRTLVLLSPFVVSKAQVPANYYDAAMDQTCATLKTTLKSIISDKVVSRPYNNLWNQYPISDIKPRTIGTGSANVIEDIYSSVPNGTDPYQFAPVTNQCGTYSKEGDCYNREHTVPLSWFNGNTSQPGIATDYNFILPTDGFVNGKRANYPYGEVASATYTSQNGSKLGKSSFPGINGTVFEPLDEYKGDVARLFFYFITRYEDSIPSWANYADASQAFDASTFPSAKVAYLKLMLKWHLNDPVSPKEIARNNAAYVYQKNRNPYIDSPQFVNAVWSAGCPGLGALPLRFVSFYVSQQKGEVVLDWSVNQEKNDRVTYIVQQASRGEAFTDVATVVSNGSGKYSKRFSFAGTGNVKSYRIKSVEDQGGLSYSPIRVLNLAKVQYAVFGKQNGEVVVDLGNGLAKELSVLIVDPLGKIVLNMDYGKVSGKLNLRLQNPASGIYYLLLRSKDSKTSYKVFLP